MWGETTPVFEAIPEGLMVAIRHVRIRNILGSWHTSPADPLHQLVQQRIRATLLSGWLKVGLLNVPVGIVVATILFASQWRQMGNPWLLTGFAAIVASYAALLWLCLSWAHRSPAADDVGPRFRRLLAVRFILTSSWAFGLVALCAVSGPPGGGILFGVSGALMSMSVFSSPIAFAMSAWIPATIGAIGTAMLIGTAPTVCAIAYTILTYFAILSFDKQMIERTRNTIRIERYAETVRILLRDFEENASDWLWEADGDLILRHVSARFAQVAQRPAEQMEIGLVALLAGNAADPPDRSLELLQYRLQAHAAFRELVVPAMVGAERRWWALTGKPLFNADGSFGGYRGVGSDVTTAHRSRERIAYLARHDTLTDLANRAGFNDAITQAVAACRTQAAALFCLDLDDFKTINDSYGHDVGDSVLRAVGQRIRGVLREHDMAARLGGDEFAVLLSVTGRDEAAAVAARLIEALTPPFACGDLDIKIGSSVGIALAPDDGDDPEILYRNADLALYRAKAAGRGTWRLFDPDMDRLLHDQRLLQRDVREALPKGELFVAYQPIVDLRSRELVSLEALVRWRHPERGTVPPATFVPVAEQSGLIGAIGMFVLTEAVHLALQLPPPIRIAVNLSPLQLRDESLLDRVRAVIEPTGLPHERIEFEITESVVLETSGRSLENLRGLRAIGHRVAIDDFGTGYSSLAVLRDFPFDRLKIDRSFITDLDADHGDGPIVKAIIGLGRALGISVTAEGVEYERQVNLLAEYRCNNAQGYYFARPLTPAQVLALLAPVAGQAAHGTVALPLPAQQRWEDAPREVIEPAAVVRLPRSRPRLVRNA